MLNTLLDQRLNHETNNNFLNDYEENGHFYDIPVPASRFLC